MSINCDIVLQWTATPEQLKAVGAALWRWCQRTAGDKSLYQYFDNQALADVLAGTFPARQSPGRNGGLPYVNLWVRGEPDRDREATLQSLRQEVPGAGIADIRVDGVSWRLSEPRAAPGP